jgi:hypothetical protein
VRARSGRATRSALLGSRCAFCQQGDASSPHGGRLRPPVETAEEHENSRSTGPIPATPASIPARYSVAIEVASLVCADGREGGIGRAAGATRRLAAGEQEVRPMRGVKTCLRCRARINAATSWLVRARLRRSRGDCGRLSHAMAGVPAARSALCRCEIRRSSRRDRQGGGGEEGSPAFRHFVGRLVRPLDAGVILRPCGGRSR